MQIKKEKTVNFQNFNASNPHRDLRPAVFIKDLKKRSLVLEEEKAQHHRDTQKVYRKKESPKQINDATKPSKVLKPTTIECLIDDKQISKKAPAAPAEGPSKSLPQLYNASIAKLESAIKKEDLSQLSETLYEVKLNSQNIGDEFYGP